MTEERFAVSRHVAAPAQQVFAVLADPSRHQDIEPTDWVRDAISTEPITGAGQMFSMNMHFQHLDGTGQDPHYITANLVNVFESDRAIGWATGSLDDGGTFQPGGWTWRYDLDPRDGGTDVTLTYDWSGTPQSFRDEIGGMPPFEEQYLNASLESLAALVTG